MTERTFVALCGGVIGGVAILVGAWVLLEAYTAIGWQIPLAAGVAVFTALWVIDWLTDEVSRRAKKP